MRILVTGGAGFVGRHLCEALLPEGFDVRLFDNFSRFDESWVEKLRGRVKIIRGDVRDFDQLNEAVHGSDVVVHLAAESRADTSVRDPSLSFRVNVDGTFNAISSCHKNGSKLIYTSSWMVYDPDVSSRKIVNEDDAVKPVTPYGLSKLIGEEYCRLFYSLYALKAVVLRLSSVYGVGDKGRLIPILISSARNNRDVHVFGAEQTLNYINVRDVVEAVVASIHKEPEDLVLNIGRSESINLVTLAKTVIERCGSKSHLLVESQRPYDYKTYKPDISKARSQLGFEARVDFDEGLKECLKYYS